jgi:HEAT repeat protein
MVEPDPYIGRLLDDLDGSDKRKIRSAVDALIALARDSAAIRETLQEHLTDRAGMQRWPVAYILASAHVPSGEILEVLLNTLDTADSDIRWAVLLLLVQLGRTDARIPTLVVQLAEAGRPTQRRMALYCLRDLRLEDEIALPAFVKGLKDPEPLVRVAAMIGLKPRPAVSDVVRRQLLDAFLKDPDSRVRSTAAVVMAQLKLVSEEFSAGLEAASRSEDPQIKKAAVAALSILQK